ncbi:MAG: DNA primase [Actinophytocola sp.]|nr:DNA primase [Actinophytocola sp.]
MNTADLRTAALAAAERGWRVFPLLPGRKQPAVHGANSCLGTGPCATGHKGWEQRATTDPERITRAWSHKPYNIGIATGPSGLLVVDLDTAQPDEQPPDEWRQAGVRDGHDVYAAAATNEAGFYADLVWDTHTVVTPSGGTHLYYAAPTDVRLRSTAGTALGWKVDTRGPGGYVVAAGSVIDGRRYETTADRDPRPLPAWLVEKLKPGLPPAPAQPIAPTTGTHGSYLDAAVRAEVSRVHTAPEGQRNYSLYCAAVALGQLVAGGAPSEHDVRGELARAAGRHVAVGAYSEAQAHKTITSGLRAGAKRPRQVAA